MNKASPIEIRKAVECANAFLRAGILFVPIPVMNLDEQVKFGAIAIEQMAKIEDECEVILTVAR